MVGPMPAGATLDRPHVWVPGDAQWPGPPLLLLHGTGGTERDLLPLARDLAPGAALLAPRGTVLDPAMPRFFRRSRVGAFDEDDLLARAAELAAFISAAAAEYCFEPGTMTAIGFSNGANVASALMLLHPQVLGAAILVSAMPPFRRPPPTRLAGHRVLISNGLRDPLAPPSLTARLVEDFSSRGAEVDVLQHPGGHQLAAAHLPLMRDFVSGQSR